MEIGRAKQERNEAVAIMLADLRSLRFDYEEKIKQYKELFDLKMELDQELVAYKTMLKGEEGRYGKFVEMAGWGVCRWVGLRCL